MCAQEPTWVTPTVWGVIGNTSLQRVPHEPLFQRTRHEHEGPHGEPWHGYHPGIHVCGHKGARAGAFMRGHIPWRCAKCVSAKSEARNAVACERASVTNEKEAQ